MTHLHPDEGSPEYEAPTIMRLGSVDELTAGTIDSDSITSTGPPD